MWESNTFVETEWIDTMVYMRPPNLFYFYYHLTSNFTLLIILLSISHPKSFKHWLQPLDRPLHFQKEILPTFLSPEKMEIMGVELSMSYDFLYINLYIVAFSIIILSSQSWKKIYLSRILFTTERNIVLNIPLPLYFSFSLRSQYPEIFHFLAT